MKNRMQTEEWPLGEVLLTRKRLTRRWQCGSDSTFWRAEADGVLVPRRRNGRVRYTWRDIWAFEGGQPPAGMVAAYRVDLLTPEDVARLAEMTPEKIAKIARRGEIPARRVGSKWRFVPAEIARWLVEAWR